MLEEAYGVFRERYVDQNALDWSSIEKKIYAKPLASEKQLRSTLEWLFTRADPFTRFLSQEQLDSMKADIEGQMCGVGIVFNAEIGPGWFGGSKRVVIKHVVKNSPADEAGLLKGDRITAIDMVGVESMSFDEATARLLGQEGKKVLISFTRASDNTNTKISVLLTRRKFEVPSVSYETVYLPQIGHVAYLQLREFATNTAAQTRTAVKNLAPDVDVFVLDLRGNSGGLVDKAVEVAKIFLSRDSIVVRFVGSDGVETSERCGWRLWGPRVNVTKQPIVILVDSETASASELVAGALRDNCRAVLVGNSTFGKGSVQAIVPLANDAGVAVTVAKYLTPKGNSIERGQGLKPDVYWNNMKDDGNDAVHELFRRGGVKRLKWIHRKLSKCSASACEVGREH